MADKVSHEDLAAAWDGEPAEGEVAEQEPEVEEETQEPAEEETEAPEPDEQSPESEDQPEAEEVPEEPEDNSERSKLGRKVAEIAQAVNYLQSLMTQNQKQEEADPLDSVDDDAPLTKAEVEKYLQLREQRAQEQQATYANSYQRGVIRAGLEMSEEEHNDVLKTIDTLPNRSRTGNPELDAKLDFAAAENRVLRQKVAKSKQPKNPLEKNKDKEPDAPLGGGAETRNASKPRQMPKLDKAAAALVAYHGMSPDRVNKVLSGDTPLNLVNPKGR